MKKTFLATLVVTAMTANANTYPDLPKGFKDGGGALIGDVVYVGLGSLGEDFYALNLAQDKADWEKLPSFPGGERSQPVIAADNGQLYVFGGLQKNEKGELQLVNDAYVYQPAEKTWKKLLTRSPLGLVGTVAATKGDKIYFIGGSNLSIFNGYFQDYTAAGKDEAKQKSVMTAYFNQRPQDYFFNTQLFSYEPSQNRWYNEGALPFSGRAGAAVAAEGDTLIVANGEVKPGLRTAEAARATFTDKGISWQALPNLPNSATDVPQEGLAGAYSGFSNDYYLIAGGANFPGARQQFESGQL
ncbi:N-acetylneuraminate epimerase precursor [Suttonella ornithocola]|uniref:N-acetylneuraminate epimerase n=1 Tax=Suttonella ornithocola TaxID=279832 RepID=A0A380MS15_9GAMM|nr:YjhT family mutarotase [Suttonella ornithocola]SUO95102.1 N-acetylneuraminate epimerase precursor [Suttonella ornithocola]